jgi:hypothetical protein
MNSSSRARWFVRILCMAILAVLVHNSAGEWSLGASESSWSVAQSAASRIQQDAGGQSIALIGLPDNRSTDAYGFPLVLDGTKVVAPDRASFLVVLCNASFSDTCDGPMERAWLAAQPNGSSYTLVDRFTPSPDRIISVYGLRPSRAAAIPVAPQGRAVIAKVDPAGNLDRPARARMLLDDTG